MDAIKKKAKRKKYNSLEHLMKDVELMFNNAMAYNLDSSEIYRDAKALLNEARELAAAEKAKPDTEYVLDDGRIPLPSGIEHKGEFWKVGDWIHIQNPNDVTKPVVAQIYRTWRDAEGQNWINACWYYRPEQTVHHCEKHFYPKEVVKTGQYRDHHIEEVIDRCFVMFFTRYNRGRPRNLEPSKEVYVCEARYNEEKHKFNKIKTWASCLPDEVRDKDYEMDLFDYARKIKKIASPLKHLLKEDTEDAQELSTPQWGNKNAPPIVGGIHKGPRDENQSPPPEPTPPPPPTPVAPPVRHPSSTMVTLQQHRPTLEAAPTSTPHLQAQLMRPTPSITPQPTNYQPAAASPAQQYGRQPSFPQITTTGSYQHSGPQTPAQSQATPYVPQQQLHVLPTYPATPAQGYGATSSGYGRPSTQQTQTQAVPQHQISNANEHRAPEAYVLSDTANESIPKDIRDQFPQDDHGRVLFFTRPPIDTRHMVSGRTAGDKGKPLVHSEKYLEAKQARQGDFNKHKRVAEFVNGEATSTNGYKRARSSPFGEERDANGLVRVNQAAHADFEEKMTEQQRRERQRASELQIKALEMLSNGVMKATANDYLLTYGEQAPQHFHTDQARARANLQEDKQRQMLLPDFGQDRDILADTQKMLGQNFWTGKFLDGTGQFFDDTDNRLPR